MLATLLLLAQLVLPWPGLDSPLVQPGPTICVGACAGPVIYGPAEQRGRLVVACDMTSDTCSDGRRITTTRATPVPCETSPGVWEMVPEDTGCYGVRGLESWAANTSYLSWGAELDRWTAAGDLVVTRTPDGQGWRLTNSTGDSQARLTQAIAQATPGEERALTCYARAASVSAMTILRDSSLGRNQVPLQAHWSQVTNVGTAVAGGDSVLLAPWPRDLQGAAVDVAGCWLAKATTPGRACWGGEAPVTCDGDRHSISTAGWPTESGEIRVTFRAGTPTSGDNAIIESRDGGTILFSLRRRASDGRISLITSGPTLDGASVEVGDTAHVRVVRDGSTVSLWVNGVKSAESGGMPAWVWSSTAVLGRNPAGQSLQLNGSISSLRVRSFE